MKRPQEACDINQTLMEQLIENVDPKSIFQDDDGKYLPVREWAGVHVESKAKRCTIAFHSID